MTEITFLIKEKIVFAFTPQGSPGNPGLEGPLGPPGSRGYEVKTVCVVYCDIFHVVFFTNFFFYLLLFFRVFQVLLVLQGQR